MMSSERTGGTATRDSLLTNSTANKIAGSTEPTPPKQENPKGSQKRSLGQRQQVQVFEDGDTQKENPRPAKQQRRETDELKSEADKSAVKSAQYTQQEPEVMELETESMIGDCLLSDYARQRRPSVDDMEPTSNLILGRGAGSDVDQLELIEEQVAKKVAAITDTKMLNQVAQMGDEQILAAEVCQICGWLRNCRACMAQRTITGGADEQPAAHEEEEATQQAQEAEDDDEEDDDDDFECDIERYVPYDEKMRLAERLKTCAQVYSKECLTDIMRRIGEAQSCQALEDYGNGRVQLKIDLIERDVYHDILKIFDRYEESRHRQPGANGSMTIALSLDVAEHLGPQSQAPSESAMGEDRSAMAHGDAKMDQQAASSACLGFHDVPADDDEDELIDVTAMAMNDGTAQAVAEVADYEMHANGI